MPALTDQLRAAIWVLVGVCGFVTTVLLLILGPNLTYRVRQRLRLRRGRKPGRKPRAMWVALSLSVAGVILGTAVAETAPGPQGPTSRTPGGPGDSLALNCGTGSVQLRQGQMLVMAAPDTVMVVRFIFHPDGAAYLWRSLDYASGVEHDGSGELYERYSRTPTDDGSFLVDVGSQLYIDVGGLEIQWSYSSDTSGWVYYRSKAVDVLDDTTFATIDLSQYPPPSCPGSRSH